MRMSRRSAWFGAALVLVLILALGTWYVVETYVNGPVPASS